MKPLMILLAGLLVVTAIAYSDSNSEDPAAYSRKILLPLVKSPGKDTALFQAFKTGEDSRWNPDFWGASLGFEQFTGIGWGTDRAGVLITPEHVISAAHYGNNPTNGVHFYGKDGAFLGHRALAPGTAGKPAFLQLPNDVRVARLASPAPEGARIYPLPNPETHKLRTDWGSLPKDELPLLLATDWRNPIPKKDPTNPEEPQHWKSTRSAHLLTLKSLNDKSIYWNYGPSGEPTIDPSYHEIVNVGDSSHPIFWVTKSGLVLASTFSSTQSGPNYGSPEIQTSIQNAINELGGTKEYTLKFAPVP